MRFYTILFAALMALTTGCTAQAQIGNKEVCCFGVEENSGNMTTFALPQSNATCKPGSRDTHGGRTICGSNNNLDNCASLSMREVCGLCGFHWLDKLGTCSRIALEDMVEKKDKPTDGATSKTQK